MVAGGVVALSGTQVLGSLSQRAVAASGYTTLSVTLKRGLPAASGFRPLVKAAGEPHQLRTDLGTPAQRNRASCRKGVLAFVHLSDVHIVDHQSPARVEWTDRYDDPANGPLATPNPGIFSSAHRPQEMLTAHVADAMVRAINRIGVGPVTARPLAFAMQTGDNTDNCQGNEVRWFIDVLDGTQVTPDSGDPTAYEGVMASDPDYWDQNYWHPDGAPAGMPDDFHTANRGFPKVVGLLDSSRRTFTPEGLDLEWYSCFGNHDGLMQGNFPASTTQFGLIAQGNLKIISPPVTMTPNTALATVQDPTALTSLLNAPPLSPGVKLVTADPARAPMSRKQIIAEHFTTSGLPRGHGFTEQNRSDGTAYYFFDKGVVRNIVLDTVNPNGYADGSLDTVQFDWLQQTLAMSKDKVVFVHSHHTSDSMTNVIPATGGSTEQRTKTGADVLALLLEHRSVIAWFNGHSHKNQIWPRKLTSGTGGLWEINTASHIDFPQQGRLVELVDNRDGTMSIFTTMIDHAAPTEFDGRLDEPLQLAALSRLLSANDHQTDFDAHTGTAAARNVELLVQAPPVIAARARCGATGTVRPEKPVDQPAHPAAAAAGSASSVTAGGAPSGGVLPDTGAPAVRDRIALGTAAVLAGHVLMRAGQEPGGIEPT